VPPAGFEPATHGLGNRLGDVRMVLSRVGSCRSSWDDAIRPSRRCCLVSSDSAASVTTALPRPAPWSRARTSARPWSVRSQTSPIAFGKPTPSVVAARAARPDEAPQTSSTAYRVDWCRSRLRPSAAPGSSTVAERRHLAPNRRVQIAGSRRCSQRRCARSACAAMNILLARSARFAHLRGGADRGRSGAVASRC
jgi:hypothetical protein